MSNADDFIIKDSILIKYNSTDEDIVLPDSVTGIGKDAFRNCKNLKSVIIPESVKSFGGGAFKGCTGLADPDGYIIVRGILFDYIGPGGDIVIPDSVKVIAGTAFLKNQKLTSVTIPNSVTRINGTAFKGCTGLADHDGFVIVQGILFDYLGKEGNLVIPEGIKRISGTAFYGCNSLVDVQIPEGVTYIGNKAFCSCINLKTIHIPEGVTDIGAEAFRECWCLESITLPRSLKAVGKDAFSSCSMLTDIHISDLAAWCNIHFDANGSNPLTSNRNLYLNDSLLKDISFSNGVVPPVVANFQNCSSLISVTIPEGVSSINEKAFYECANLSSVTISKSVTSIGEKAFKGCTNLANSDGLVIFQGILFDYMGSDENVTIPESVTYIGNSAFSGCKSLASVKIPKTVTEIGDYAFYDCKNLTDIRISENVKSIGKCAFSNCESLKDITIPTSVTYIGDNTFFNCKSLRSVKIPKSVIEIGDNAFYNCNSLTDITILEGVKSIGKCAFSNCKKLTNIIIPEGVKSISEEAFRWCGNLTSITIPTTLAVIGKDAFSGCDQLKEIRIDDATAWSAIQFENDYANPLRCGYMKGELFLKGEPLTELIFTDAVSSTKIANFGYCKSLIKAIIPEGVTEIGSKAFYDCQNLESITLPESVISIGDEAFCYCQCLKSIMIPESAESIGDRAFSGCKKVETISIPKNVKRIGDYAFSGCENLTKAFLPEKLQIIGKHAFASCPNLTVCNIPASISEWGGIPAAYVDGVYYTDNEGEKEILEIFAPGSEEYEVPTWAAKIRESALVGTPLKKITVSAGTIIDENTFGKYANYRNSVIFTGSFLETKKELPVYYINFLEKAVKTPKVLAVRMLYQSGKQWNETLTKAAQEVDKTAIVCEMAHLVEENAEEKLAAKFAGTVLDYLEELGKEELKIAYSTLRKGGFKALRKLVLDEAFQNKWLTASESEELSPVEEMVKKNWRTTDAVKKLRTMVKEGVHYRNSEQISSPKVLVFVLNEYADQLEDPAKLAIGDYQTGYVRGLHISELADQVANALNLDELRERLEALVYTEKTFRSGFVFALARYGSGKQISHLCSVMRERANWGKYGVSGRQDVKIARGALMLSETREAMIALDKVGMLEPYAQMRGTDAETIRDTVLSDFGFDQKGRKIYDLGGNHISVSMASDLTLEIYDENAKKNVKSIPKKNADVTLYEAAKADVSDLKKNIKRVTKHRRDSIFADFLSGGAVDTAKWKKVYCGNPVLGAVARLIVWEQSGKTFTLSDTGMVDSVGAPVVLDDAQTIRVAHPIEMMPDEIKAWQDYFVRNGLKQPFEQIWEPVYDLNSISSERYKGAVLPIYRFENKDQHGIHSYGLTAYSEDYGFELDDCELDAEGSTWRIVPGITDDETYTLGTFKVTKRSRKSNHIIFVLDKWTVMDRIEKDDDSIVALLPVFTLAQLTEFIRLANEKGSIKCQAALMDYKDRNYEAKDPFAEFTLD